MEELRRQAGWAKTFGLPMEMVSADEAKRDVPADVHRWGPRRRLDPHRRLPRPRATHLRARRWSAPGWLPVFTGTRVTGIDVRAGGAGREHGTGRCGRPTSSSTPRGSMRGEIGRMAGVRVAGGADVSRVPRDPALPRARPTARPLPTLRDPDLLDLFSRGGRRLGHGRVRASQRVGLPSLRRRGAGARSRATSTAACSRRTGTGSPRWSKTAAPAGAGDGRDHRDQAHQRS